MSVSSQLRSLDETLTNLSGNLTTSVGDLEAIVVNISDSVSNVTKVDNFIQETFLSLTGDLTLEEALANLGDKLVRNVKWKKLEDTLVRKMDLDNLSRKDESTGVRYLNTRGPGCTEGTCSGWLV